jgi:phosphatidylinositol alpha-1,6-mannosyltransferase
MKTILFTLEYPPFKGGVANYYDNIVKHWPDRNKITVLNNNDGKLINTRLPFLKWLPSIFRLRQEVKNKQIDHVIVGHILPLGTAAYIIFRLMKIPYSVILHGMDLTLSLKAGRRKEWLAKKILKNASRIICASSFTAGLAKEVVGEKMADKIKVVNPGVDSQLTINNYQLTINLKKKYNLENKIVLFSIGRLVKRKGFDKVIEAMPEILKEVPSLVYVIAGIGPDEEYLKDAPFIKGGVGGFKDSVIFLGKISDEEKWAWLDICDIFTMPSRQIGDDFEGFGIVYLEASLAGKPIVAGRSGGVEDAVLDNKTGLLVNPESTEEIANAIIKLSKDEDLRKKLGEAGKKRAEEEFDWGKQISRIYSIIKKD